MSRKKRMLLFFGMDDKINVEFVEMKHGFINKHMTKQIIYRVGQHNWENTSNNLKSPDMV